ncbi:protein S40-2-like [Amaranthus tricolor]|uniref:protein S40-2-like n=1 Tax=Amaranthus tricolor TaxID=29722 RepID=UPI0025908A6E|nr:protein S40-2-like [Amaranthus tricolor]
MDFDEFEESEMIFSDYSSDQIIENKDMSKLIKSKKIKSVSKKQRVRSLSVPINIPDQIISTFEYDVDVVSFEPFDEIMKMPPHLIVEKRGNQEMARSFSPIKGKILCEVRNSILRMTGFLET